MCEYQCLTKCGPFSFAHLHSTEGAVSPTDSGFVNACVDGSFGQSFHPVCRINYKVSPALFGATGTVVVKSRVALTEAQCLSATVSPPPPPPSPAPSPPPPMAKGMGHRIRVEPFGCPGCDARVQLAQVDFRCGFSPAYEPRGSSVISSTMADGKYGGKSSHARKLSAAASAAFTSRARPATLKKVKAGSFWVGKQWASPQSPACVTVWPYSNKYSGGRFCLDEWRGGDEWVELGCADRGR